MLMDNNLKQNFEKSSQIGVNVPLNASAGGLGNIWKNMGHFSGGKSEKTPKKQKTQKDYEFLKERFLNLRKSQEILRSVLPPKSGILGCMKYVISDMVDIEKADGEAVIHNVVTCKSKHVCPVEAPTIAKVESKYIRQAIEACRRGGKDVYMLTLTSSHHAGQSLKHCLDMFHKATASLWADGSTKRFKKTYFEGKITVIEVTWGSNGWHVHEHILMFGERGLAAKGVGSFFSSQWIKALCKVGLSGVPEIACTFQSASQVKNYLTKMANEMSMFCSKKGRAGGHYTPFQILSMCEDVSDSWADLWREYALAMKGVRQLVWSDHLKEKYGIEDKSDEEIADEAYNEIKANVRLMIRVFARDYVSKLSSPDALAYIKNSSVEECFAYLDSLGIIYGT